MNYLAIDYGEAKVGLAFSNGALADPLEVIYYQDKETLFKKIIEAINREKADFILIGLPEGKIATSVHQFYEELSKRTDKKIELVDETLSTKEANSLAIEAGISRKKRRRLEDAYSASLILQAYLDSQNVNHL